MPDTALTKRFGLKRRPVRKAARRPERRRLRIEPLEGRQLLSAVYTQPPSAAGGVIKSAWYAPNGLDGDQYVFDNFALAATQTITQVQWRGGYTNFLSGAGESPVYDFTISIYASIPGGRQPDVAAAPLVHYSVGGNAGETPAGTVAGIPLYDYSSTLPTPFDAVWGTTYWLQIEAVQGLTPVYSWPPDWGLAVATGGDGWDFRAITGGSPSGGTSYGLYAGDTAFTLLGPTAPVAPTIVVSGGPFTYDNTAHAANVAALAADGVTPVAGVFSLAYAQNGVAVNPVNAGVYDVTAAFTSSDPNYANATGTGKITINKATPALSNLASPTIAVGTSSAVLSGHIAAGALLPSVGEQVRVTVNGATQSASIDAQGNFSTTFSAGTLPPGAYSVVYSYVGNANFNAAPDGRSILSVTGAASKPTVTAQPKTQTASAGNLVVFTSAAACKPASSVQWQVSLDGGRTYRNIAGATGSVLSFLARAGDDGNRYRAVFANCAGTAATSAAKLTVLSAPLVTRDPLDQTVAAGLRVSFTAAATGNPRPAVQWQVSVDGGKTYKNIPGAVATRLTFVATAKQRGFMYRAAFTNRLGAAWTAAATLRV